MSSLPDKMPWYADGLSFECVGCGRCCAGPEEGYVYLTAEEISAIADYLKIDENDLRSKYIRHVGVSFSLKERSDNRDCVFLSPPDGDGLRCCLIYPVRPAQCRAWPFWPANLTGPDDWERAGRRCRGINRGRVFRPDEIEAQGNVANK